MAPFKFSLGAAFADILAWWHADAWFPADLLTLERTLYFVCLVELCKEFAVILKDGLDLRFKVDSWTLSCVEVDLHYDEHLFLCGLVVEQGPHVAALQRSGLDFREDLLEGFEIPILT